MRKILLLACVIALMIVAQSPVFAEQSITVHYNRVPQSFSSVPIIKDGTTYVPMRDAFSLFGFNATWDEQNRTAVGTKNGFEIKIPIDSPQIYVGSIPMPSSAPAFIADGKTYIPLRILSDVIGVYVKWVPLNQRIEIYSDPIDQEAKLQDPVLKDYLLAQSGKAHSSDLLISDVRLITRIDVSDRKIDSLEGLDQAVYLQEIIAPNSHIGSLLAIRTLTHIKKLDLRNNQLRDAQTVQNFKQIEYLDLQNNDLVSLAGLDSLKNLKTIFVAGNGLNLEDDFGPLYYYSSDVKIDVDRALWKAPKYDSELLRTNAAYVTTVSEGIEWVPAIAAGAANVTNEGMDNLIKNTAQGKKSNIKSLYDLVHFLGNWSYSQLNDDQLVLDDLNKRIWKYHRNPDTALTRGGGSDKALSVACAYTLQTDYQESGVTVLVDKTGHESFLNYVYDGKYYYMFNPLMYLKGHTGVLPVEDGTIATYDTATDKTASIHRVVNILDYVKYYTPEMPAAIYTVKVLDDEEAQYPMGYYSPERKAVGNFYYLPIDAPELDEDDDDFNYWAARITVLYDNPNDALYFKRAVNPTQSPDWK